MSAYYMALEVKQVQAGMMIALPPEERTIVRTMSVADFRGPVETAPQPYEPRPLPQKQARPEETAAEPKDPYESGGHVSTYKEPRAKDP